MVCRAVHEWMLVYVRGVHGCVHEWMFVLGRAMMSVNVHDVRGCSCMFVACLNGCSCMIVYAFVVCRGVRGVM